MKCSESLVEDNIVLKGMGKDFIKGMVLGNSFQGGRALQEGKRQKGKKFQAIETT